MHYAWFVWSLMLLALWVLVYFFLQSKESRKEMFRMSLWTSLLGLTEPLFVPAYWNPPSLFDLAQKTGFDIESLIFAFGVGGLAVVIYESIFPVRHRKVSEEEQKYPRHRYHAAALLVAPILFAALLLLTRINPIYAAFVALMGGGIATWYCRPDLKKKMLASGLMVTLVYFFYFLTLVAMYPGYVPSVWNFSALSGILIVGVPLEELLFALGLGFFWSSVYEHIAWRTIKDR